MDDLSETPLWRECNALLSEFADNAEERPQNTIYHYTNFNGLKGILESQKLWLSDYKSLNDTSEISYALKKVKEIINKTADGHTAARKFLLSDFWRKFIFEFNEFVAKSELYIVSFCNYSNYLPAWRWYSDDGAGFAIGFNKNFFSTKEDKRNIKAVCHKIHYKADDFEGLIKKLIQEAENRLLCSESDSSVNFTEHKNIMITIFCHILPVLGKIKHEAYKEEGEYRLIVDPQIHSDEIKREIFCRLGTGLVNCIPAISYPYSKEDISEIFIGSKCNFQIAKNKIEMILDENGFYVETVKIKKSDIPYKNKDFHPL